MRYIDIIRTLIRNASEKDIPALDWDEQQKHLNMIKARIDDVELVVRCKDCKLWQIDSHCDGYRSAEDFCSWGERREDGEE